MSDTFRVDVVATPRLDLCGAAAQDLKYMNATGKYPMEAKSQMAREQEKLNKFLQYVNESFIIKGFSRNSAAQQSGVRGMTASNSANVRLKNTEHTLCEFTLSHGGGAQLLTMFSITGEAVRSGTAPAYLTVKIYEDQSQVAVFNQSYSEACYLTFGLPFLLPQRSEGVSVIRMTAQVSGGEVYVLAHGAAASVLMVE